MHDETRGNHYRIVFDSFGEYLKFHEDSTPKASFRQSWNGARDPKHAVKIARKGLDAQGLAAMNAATDLLPALDAELIDTRFKPVMGTEGAYVDVGLYLTGEPECMVSFDLDASTQVEPIVTLVIATGVLGHVSGEAIAARGQRVMALLQAVELAGIQAELWSDSTTRTWGDLTGRISVRLKAAGEAFDAGTLMYAMTHDSMHRVLGFNTKDHFPGQFGRAMGAQGSYGSTALGDLIHPEDYPPGSVYLPALRCNSDTLNVEDTLRRLGLLT